jgi:hypothetical protein
MRHSQGMTFPIPLLTSPSSPSCVSTPRIGLVPPVPHWFSFFKCIINGETTVPLLSFNERQDAFYPTVASVIVVHAEYPAVSVSCKLLSRTPLETPPPKSMRSLPHISCRIPGGFCQLQAILQNTAGDTATQINAITASHLMPNTRRFLSAAS